MYPLIFNSEEEHIQHIKENIKFYKEVLEHKDYEEMIGKRTGETSNNKGKVFEYMIDLLLKHNIGNLFEIIRNNKIRRMDLRLRHKIEEYLIGIECKDKKVITKKDIEKFKRDKVENKFIKSIFVSTHKIPKILSEEDIKTKLRDNGMNFIRILERKLSWNNIEQRHKPNAGTQTKIYVMFTNEIMLDKLAKRIKRELVKISGKSSTKRIERAFNKVIRGRKNDLSAFDRLYDYIYSKMNEQEKIEVEDYKMVTFVQELMGNTPLIVGMKPVLNNTYNPGDEKATFTLIADPLIKRVGETDEQFEMRKNNPNEFLEEGEYPNLQTIRRRRNESVAEFARRKKYFLEFIDYEE